MILDYESPEVIPQGKRIAEFVVDMALKKGLPQKQKGLPHFCGR
jgi:hypothetical protein